MSPAPGTVILHLRTDSHRYPLTSALLGKEDGQKRTRLHPGYSRRHRLCFPEEIWVSATLLIDLLIALISYWLHFCGAKDGEVR